MKEYRIPCCGKKELDTMRGGLLRIHPDTLPMLTRWDGDVLVVKQEVGAHMVLNTLFQNCPPGMGTLERILDRMAQHAANQGF